MQHLLTQWRRSLVRLLGLEDYNAILKLLQSSVALGRSPSIRYVEAGLESVCVIVRPLRRRHHAAVYMSETETQPYRHTLISHLSKHSYVLYSVNTDVSEFLAAHNWATDIGGVV
jgi:hypothetical protein